MRHIIAAGLLCAAATTAEAQTVTNLRACSDDNTLTVVWELDTNFQGFGPALAIRPRASSEGTPDREPRAVQVPDPMRSAQVQFKSGSAGFYSVALVKSSGDRIAVGDFLIQGKRTDGDCPLALPAGEIVLAALPPLEKARDSTAKPTQSTPSGKVNSAPAESPSRESASGNNGPNGSPNQTPNLPLDATRIQNSVDKAARVLHRAAPEYSKQGRKARIQGMVLLHVEIWEDGLAHNIRILRSLGCGLDEKAIEAIKKWRFAPSERDGKPVRTAAQIHVKFQLDRDVGEPLPCPTK